MYPRIGVPLLLRNIQSVVGGEERFNHHVKVFPDEGVVYCATPKVGCTKIMQMMLEALHNEVVNGQQVHRVADNVLTSPKQMGYARFIEWYYGTRGIKTFLFVRNPLDRLASAYRDKITGEFSAGDEIAFARERRKIESWCVKAGFKNDPDGVITFLQFLHYCAGERLKRLNPHWAPQSSICWSGILRHNHIYPYSDFASGVTDLMAELGVDHDWSRERLMSRANQSAGSKKDTDLTNVPKRLRAAITRRYSGDLDLHNKTN